MFILWAAITNNNSGAPQNTIDSNQWVQMLETYTKICTYCTRAIKDRGFYSKTIILVLKLAHKKEWKLFFSLKPYEGGYYSRAVVNGTNTAFVKSSREILKPNCTHCILQSEPLHFRVRELLYLSRTIQHNSIRLPSTSTIEREASLSHFATLLGSIVTYAQTVNLD